MERNEKIFLSIAALLSAFIILYNLFFTPQIPILQPENYKDYDINIQDNNINNVQERKEDNTININSASEEELTELKGIGEIIAKRIIEYRESNGGFLNIEEIKNVKGIGAKLFEKIKNKIKI